MFDITPEHIAALNDADLRTLIGLLCEAESRKSGISPARVTYGGDQNTVDGGIDVRVERDSAIGGFLPRASIGFQVKATKMPPSKIRKEIMPDGVVRPAIQELAVSKGAYILVSSKDSLSDTTLRKRRAAMANSVASTTAASELLTKSAEPAKWVIIGAF